MKKYTIPKCMVYKWIQKQVKRAVEDYISRLPDAQIVAMGSKIIGAAGLTEETYRKLIETAKGEKTVTIYFTGGDVAVISNTSGVTKGGPGW